MREWINIVEGVDAEPQILEEKGFGLGHLAAAAALAGTAGYHANSSSAAEPDDLPQMVMSYEDTDGVLADEDRKDREGAITPAGRTLPAKMKPKDHATPTKGRSASPSVAHKSTDLRGDIAKQTNKEAVQLLALTMWGEARSDGPEAMRAVGHVIMNRMKSKRQFGRNIKEVVWKRKAFSCWNKSDPNRVAMEKIATLPEGHPSKVRWDQAVNLAQDITSGRSKDPTAGSLFYHTKAMGKPYWVSQDMKPDAQIASHLFYKSDAKSS